MSQLYLEWMRCPDGVQLQPDRHTPEGVERLESGELEVFRLLSERRDPVIFSSVDLENPVVLQFINARSDAEQLAFFGRFGLFFGGDIMLASNGLKHRQFLEKMTRGMLSGDASARTKAANRLLEGVQLRPSFGTPGEVQKPVLRFQPENLQQFVCMEVALAAVNEVSLAECERCERLFFTGPLTGRRSHAKFCSDRCRVAAMRKRNAAAAAGGR